MTLRIEQDTELVKTVQPRDGTSPALGWWRWRVWVEGEEEELGRIKWVRYQLHPTFPEPTRIVTDLNSKFALQSAGWGEFTIYAAVHFIDGSEQNFKHWLRLAARTTRPAHTLGGEAPKLYLAYAFADTHIAQAVGQALRARHVQVLDPHTEMEVGDDWAGRFGSSLDAADVAAVFISESAPPWWKDEVRRIQNKGIDLLPIVVVGTQPPELPQTLQQYGALQVKLDEDPTAISDRILQQMPALLAGGQDEE